MSVLYSLFEYPNCYLLMEHQVDTPQTPPLLLLGLYYDFPICKVYKKQNNQCQRIHTSKQSARILLTIASTAIRSIIMSKMVQKPLLSLSEKQAHKNPQNAGYTAPTNGDFCLYILTCIVFVYSITPLQNRFHINFV